MIVDFALLIIVSLLGVGLTVVGGFVASDKKWVRVCFLIGGPLLVIGTISQGFRQIKGQIDSDNEFMHLAEENSKDRQRSNAKIDSLFALLQPQAKKTPAVPPKKPAESAPKELLPSNYAKLTIAQTPKTSTRADAPYETEVVIQTNGSFPTLKLAIQCDKPITDGDGYVTGEMMSAGSQFVLRDHPNIYFFSYSSSAPSFDPAHPVVIDLWSKEPLTCNQAATY